MCNVGVCVCVCVCVCVSLANYGYYMEDTKIGGIKRNVSKGDLDLEKEEVMSFWVIAATP